MTTSPSPTILRFDVGLPLDELGQDVCQVPGIVCDLESQCDFLADEDWLSVPLINAEGDKNDHGLEPLDRAGRPTPHLTRLPWTRLAAARLVDHGMTIEHLRLLVLRPGGIFWPHRDVHDYFRILMPISADDGACPYYLGGDFYLVEVGSCCYIQPDAPHAAFNFTDDMRAVLCFDVTLGRRAVDFLLDHGRRPEPFTGRFTLSRVMEEQVRRMIAGGATADPDATSKLALLLMLGFFETPVERAYGVLHGGLSGAHRDHVQKSSIQRLDGLLTMLERHPGFPRSDSPPMGAPDKEISS